MRAEDLVRHLKGGLAPLYVLHGEEGFLTLESAQAIREAALRHGFGEREVLTVESGFSWSQLTASGNSFSLFAEKKLVELRVPTGKPGVEGAKVLEAYASRLPEDTVTVVQMPKLDRTTQNAKWFQALSQHGEVIEARPIERSALPNWIALRLTAQQQQLDADAMRFLVDRVEGNLFAAHQEVLKLGLLHAPGTLTLEQVREAVANVARYDVFQMGEALLAGDATRFVRMLDGLRAEGEAPHLVLWALSEEVRALWRLAQGRANGANMGQLYKENRVWGAKQGLVDKALDRVSGPQLRQALSMAARIDQINKGVGQGDAWDELLSMCLPLLKPTATRPGR
ncbi:DNA polymerase III subunit delta [Silvimonas amylolytica]|uniref:DNA polymerase III subunit delta n=1 Tax=Silvimonas amylolytica TaxID=449663 RepID=A0ABQ2PJL2_9NEIS|nr:DNA polymerase III subunit delta [Silvimonas amylolytica]GGP25425.1 DNA polymerase III subunit delta [Silvimonas amylolytica]